MCSVLCFVKKTHNRCTKVCFELENVRCRTYSPCLHFHTEPIWARWRDEILSRQRAQKTFAWLHTAFETDIFLLPSLSRGTNFWHIFSKGWKFFTTVTKHFYTFLPLIPSDKFWRNFCIFPWRNCGRKIRDFKEWSKIRVSCFFWQIKLGKK